MFSKSNHGFYNLIIFISFLIVSSNFCIVFGARTYYRGTPKTTPASTPGPKPVSTSTQKPSVPLIYDINETCEIPPLSSGTDYSVYDPREHEIKYKPGARVPRGSTLTVDCKSGYLHQDSSNSYLSTCNGISKVAWHPVIKECLRVCKPIRARNIDLTCTFRGQLVNCSYPLLTGTEVEPAPCQSPFQQSFTPDYQNIKCLETGEWDKELFQCISENPNDDIFSVRLNPAREAENSECTCPRGREPENEIIGSVGSCEIPQHGPEMKYIVYGPTNNEIQVEPGLQVPRGSTLSLDCADGYLHEDGKKNTISTCSGINEIFWNPPITNCFRACKPLRASNVAITCTFKGQLVNCSKPLLAGTEVQPADCEPPFHQSFKPDYRIITCQENGEWDNMLFKCLPDCGKPHDSEKLIFDGIEETNTEHSPWNIAIYDTRHSPPLLICGGTIINPLMIISAAHCFYIEEQGMKEVPTHYKVVTGKIKRDFSTHDTDSQTVYEIKDIHFSSDNVYHPPSKNYAADIAILVLRELISFNFLVLPACMDWISVNRFSPRKFKVGKLYGWGIDNSGFPSEVLRTAELPYISYNECLKKVNTLEFDKFCAGYDQGAGARKGDSGAGLLFENENDRLFYLRGIVSSRDKYTNTSIAKFTDLTFHITWIQKMYKQVENEISQRQIPISSIPSPANRPGGNLYTTPKPDIKIPVYPDGLCEIPANTPDKNYTIRDAENNQISLPPGTKVPESYTILFQCNDGYLYKDHGSGSESKSSFSRCVPAGIWNPPIKSCSKICETVIPPLYATLQCVYDTKPINCASNLVAGTLIYSKCDPMFHYEKEVNYSRMTCQENGKYDVVLGDCIPNCGKSNPTKLVFGRNQPEKGEDPWNVAIYNIRSEPPDLVCSGTIVSPLMVLSAAHCFGNVSELSKVVPTDYQVVVGKINRDYKTVDTNWQKAYDVREINFADRGQHPLGYFAADIAVLIVRERLKFDRFVLPACVDWRSTRVFNPGPNATGRFIGWGWIEEFNRPNDVLAAARLNFMSLKDCKNRIKNPEFDTFCALAEAADEACKADSGGGLVFPTKDRTFYLRGIIGENDYENETSIKKFTDISKHIDWLYEIFDKTSRAKYALRMSK